MQQRARDTRQKILKAACAEFSAKGLHGARVDLIAKRAGANKERLYAYFGGKEQLFRVVLREAFDDLIAAEQRLLTRLRADPARLTEAILEHYLQFQEEHPHFWRLLAWENLRGGKAAQGLSGIRAETFGELKRLYRRRQPAVPFEAFIFTLTAVVFFLFSNRLTMSQTLDLDLASPAVRRRLLANVLQLIQHE